MKSIILFILASVAIISHADAKAEKLYNINAVNAAVAVTYYGACLRSSFDFMLHSAIPVTNLRFDQTNVRCINLSLSEVPFNQFTETEKRAVGDGMKDVIRDIFILYMK